MALVLNVPKPEFLSALSSLQNITAKKGTLAVLANILFETREDGLLMTATDLEIGIRCLVPAEIISPGRITIPARKIFEVVRESEESHIHLEEQENFWVHISGKTSDCRLAGIGADEFPSFPPYLEENMVEIPSRVISDLIDKTIYSVASEGEGNFNLAGTLFEKDLKDNQKYLRMVTSDGHRLTFMECRVESEIEKLDMDRVILIPKKGVSETRKLCEAEESVWLGVEEKQIVFKVGSSILVIRLMSGNFPDYRGIFQVINKAKYIEIDRKTLLNSLKRVNLFTEDIYNSVNFNIENSKITLSSQNMDYGSAVEEVPVNYEGERIAIGFNGKYFYESLQVMESEKVKAYINSEESPCMIQGDDDPGYISVIMPMKL